MKKVMAFLAVLIICAGLFTVSALADLSPKDVVGTWYVQSCGEDNLSVLGIDVVIKVNRDKTATITMNGDPTSETWGWSIIKDRFFLLLNGKSRATYGEFEMTDAETMRSRTFIYVNDVQWEDLILVRHPVEPEKMPETIPVENEDAFYGVYQASKYFSQGYASNLISADEISEGFIVIDFAEATLYDGDEDEGTFLTNFVDGKLLLYYEYRGHEEVYEIGMLADGSLLVCMDDEAMIFVPVDAAEWTEN